MVQSEVLVPFWIVSMILADRSEPNLYTRIVHCLRDWTLWAEHIGWVGFGRTWNNRRPEKSTTMDWICRTWVRKFWVVLWCWWWVGGVLRLLVLHRFRLWESSSESWSNCVVMWLTRSVVGCDRESNLAVNNFGALMRLLRWVVYCYAAALVEVIRWANWSDTVGVLLLTWIQAQLIG